MKVKLHLEGKEYEIQVQEEETILQRAQEEEIDAPYSCESAACGTCKAKLLSGEVDMEMDDALDDDEIEAGYILTCQSHPSTDVEIEYPSDPYD